MNPIAERIPPPAYRFLSVGLREIGGRLGFAVSLTGPCTLPHTSHTTQVGLLPGLRLAPAGQHSTID
jgi:hypothetical protein